MIAIRPRTSPAATPVKQPKLDWTRIHAFNDCIRRAHLRYSRMPTLELSPGETLLNAACKAAPADALLIMHRDADGMFTRLDVVTTDGEAVTVDVK